MPDLAVGETTEMKGSGSKPYVIKNCGPGVATPARARPGATSPSIRLDGPASTSASCAATRPRRTRIGVVGELPSRKPEEADEGKDRRCCWPRSGTTKPTWPAGG